VNPLLGKRSLVTFVRSSKWLLCRLSVRIRYDSKVRLRRSEILSEVVRILNGEAGRGQY